MSTSDIPKQLHSIFFLNFREIPIGIRRLQCILLKICLLLGVVIHAGVEFVNVTEPTEIHPYWSLETNPKLDITHLNAIIGAQGRRVTIPGTQGSTLDTSLGSEIASTEQGLNLQPANKKLGHFINGHFKRDPKQSRIRERTRNWRRPRTGFTQL